jgi:hypothetical protein
MMSLKVNRFNGAVHECLEECYRSPLPLACLAEYSQRLRASGWREAEIEEVESVVRRLLKAIVAPEASDEMVQRKANATG